MKSLSDKILETYDETMIAVEDVKQSIKKLKREIFNRRFYMSCDEITKLIDKHMGKKLI